MERSGWYAIVTWVALGIGLAAYVGGLTAVHNREQAIEARSNRVDAVVVDIEDDNALFAWVDADTPRSAWVHFSPSDVKGTLERGEHVEILVDAERPTRVHMPGNLLALVGETNAALLGAAPLLVLGGIIAAIVMTYSWRSTPKRTS